MFEEKTKHEETAKTRKFNLAQLPIQVYLPAATQKKLTFYLHAMKFNIHFLDRQQDFDEAIKQVSSHEWLGFDTEFVGEKTYIPVLCLLQIVAGDDIFLVDTLKIKDLDRFLSILENPAVLKITHAGDNDYRLLNTLFGTVPKNTFDTQIAAGFSGYNYPAGFSKICERELRISLAKSHTTADWEARPIEPKALDYAIEDVKFLPSLHQKLTAKLRRHHRESWAREENRKWESPDFYQSDPYREAFAGEFIYQLDTRDQIFLMRLYVWRREKAAAANVPREAILQNKHIVPVVKAIRHGLNGFRSNRTLTENVWRKHLADWENLYRRGTTPEELRVLETLPAAVPDDPERDWMHDFLYLMVKKACNQHEISAALLMPKGDFNKLKNAPESFDQSLLAGWRAELLGAELTAWLKKLEQITVRWEAGECRISMA